MSKYIPYAMILAALGALVACIIVRPDDAVMPAIGLITTIIAAFSKPVGSS